MKVLLSIKPEFAEKIFDGNKRFEYRKSLFKNTSIKTVIVYVSSPVKKVIGEFEIEKFIQADKESLWKQTKDYSGITKTFFDEYFEGREFANAISIKSVKRYDIPKCLKSDFDIHFAPQSFIYLK